MTSTTLSGRPPSSSRATPATWAGLFVALVVFNVFAFAIQRLRPDADRRPDDIAGAFVGIGLTWLITAGLLAIVFFWEREDAGSIGVRGISWRDTAIGVGGFMIGGLSFLVTSPIVEALGLRDVEERANRLGEFPIWLLVIGVATNAITEEVIFRGYVIERLTMMTGSVRVGAAIAYLGFIVGHLPGWGIGGTIQIGMWALIPTVLYAWRRNLWPCVVMHGINNAVGLILIPRL